MAFGVKLKKHITFLDVIAILLLLAFAGISHKYMHKTSNRVQILINNKTVKTLNLGKNQVYKIDEHTIIEVKNGKARIQKSDCKNQICVKQGWQNKTPIICVPKKIMLKFDNEQKLLITK